MDMTNANVQLPSTSRAGKSSNPRNVSLNCYTILLQVDASLVSLLNCALTLSEPNIQDASASPRDVDAQNKQPVEKLIPEAHNTTF